MDIKEQLTQRMQALQREGQQVAQAAANQAFAPFAAAIGEIQNTLKLLEQAEKKEPEEKSSEN